MVAISYAGRESCYIQDMDIELGFGRLDRSAIASEQQFLKREDKALAAQAVVYIPAYRVWTIGCIPRLIKH